MVTTPAQRAANARWKAKSQAHLREYDRKWRAENPDKVKASKVREYEKHSEAIIARVVDWQRRNPERVNAKSKAWDKKNPHRKPARKARRRAGLLSASPPWVDRKALAAVYAECKRISAETGIRHEVDHIHPLKGKNLCGLHVPWNLQIITGEANRRKFTSVELPAEAAVRAVP